MDTFRGGYDAVADGGGYDAADDEVGRDHPPIGIGTDERRMQVRAYKHWASLLASDRLFPAIDELDTNDLPDFAPFSVLLDFTAGIENPGIAYLGEELAKECGAGLYELQSLADVHSRSLLSRITDHYMQIIANQAPIGFEAEFVNQRGATILYRGILLPFSSDDDAIDFIYGVINWKELADQQASDELLLEIDRALEPRPARAPSLDAAGPLTDWADGPGAVPANDIDAYEADDGEESDDHSRPAPALESDESQVAARLRQRLLGTPPEREENSARRSLTRSQFGSLLKTPIHFPEKPTLELTDEVPAFDEEPTQIDLAELEPADMALGDWLAAARETAAAARSSEDRTRQALYEAIGQAYDFSLAAEAAPEEFAELLSDAGLTVQDRAPMTPVVKLVFGADYDKTRLTEYAAALAHGHRLGLMRGELGEFLGQTEGGLKGVVAAERRLRRDESGKPAAAAAPSTALTRKLRALNPHGFADIAAQGSEFALVLIRRSDVQGVEVLGEVPEDVALIERAARRLVG